MDTINSANKKQGSSGIPLVYLWCAAAVPLGDRKMRHLKEGFLWCSAGIPSLFRWCSKKRILKNEANYLSFGEVGLHFHAAFHSLNSHLNSQLHSFTHHYSIAASQTHCS